MVPPLDHFQGKNENRSSLARTISVLRRSFLGSMLPQYISQVNELASSVKMIQSALQHLMLASEKPSNQEHQSSPLPVPISPTRCRSESPEINAASNSKEPASESTSGFDPFDPASNHQHPVVQAVESNDGVAIDQHQSHPYVPRARPFLLPTPPAHMRLNWLDGCACQKFGIPHHKPKRRRRKKNRGRKPPANSPPSSSETLLIDLN